jgi:hypothetical protein
MFTKCGVDLRQVRLRANPAYELVLFDRLSPSEKQALEAIGRDPDGYGVLRPRAGGGLSTKSVSRDTALLWFTLQSPAPLPGYVVRMLGDTCDQVISEMILDGVLEIESDGRMLTGPAAHAQICDCGDKVQPVKVLATLSRRALDYAAALEVPEPRFLSARLYGYNRVPASARWWRIWSDPDAVEQYLGIGNGDVGKLLAGWTRVRPDAEAPAWIAWNSQDAGSERGDATYKLYVSPACSEVRAAFEIAAPVMARCHAVHMKIGADIYGLLRPDKLIGYFRTIADLHEAASRIYEKASGCPAQGVPFSAEIGGDGLLSWGIDPADDKYAVPWLKRKSWRVRICDTLATALLQAKSAGQTADSARRFAMDRLQLEGVDTETWAPDATSAGPSGPGEIRGHH